MTNQKTELHSEFDTPVQDTEAATLTENNEADTIAPNAADNDTPHVADTGTPQESSMNDFLPLGKIVQTLLSSAVEINKDASLLHYKKDIVAQTIPSLALANESRLISENPEDRSKAVTDVVDAAFALADEAAARVKVAAQEIADRAQQAAATDYFAVVD